MNNDLISRSALLKVFEDVIPTLEKYSESEMVAAVEGCISDLQNAPAVDAVEVVRCVECANNKTCHRVVIIMPREEDYGVMCGRLHYCEYGVRRADDGE